MFFQQLVNGLTLGSVYAVIAIGYTLVFGVLNIVNMAHGGIIMMGAYIGLLLVTVAGWGIVPRPYWCYGRRSHSGVSA